MNNVSETELAYVKRVITSSHRRRRLWPEWSQQARALKCYWEFRRCIAGNLSTWLDVPSFNLDFCLIELERRLPR